MAFGFCWRALELLPALLDLGAESFKFEVLTQAKVIEKQSLKIKFTKPRLWLQSWRPEFHY